MRPAGGRRGCSRASATLVFSIVCVFGVTWSARAQDDPQPVGLHGGHGIRLDGEAGAGWVTPREGAPVGLSLLYVGRGGPAEDAVDIPLQRRGARIERRAASFTEWFASSPDGIEHGFDIGEPPPGRGALTLSLLVRGEREPVSVTSAHVVFLDPNGVGPLHYTDPLAIDAEGRPLHVELRVESRRLELVVDDEEATYPVQVDPLLWDEVNVLMAPVAAASNTFGRAFDLEGDVLAVGAPTTLAAGHVFVFRRSGPAWSLEATLQAPGAPPGGYFGAAVALSGDRLIVSEYLAAGEEGRVHAFERIAGTWRHAAALASPLSPRVGRFGSAIAMEGDLLAVEECGRGDTGRVHVYRRVGVTWSLEATVQPSSPPLTRCVAVDLSRLVISAGRLAYGAPVQDNGDGSYGAAYILEQVGGVWQDTAYLRAPSAEPGFFGAAVDLLGDLLLVGANDFYLAGAGSPTQSLGRAHLYRRSGGSWALTDTLSAPPTPVVWDAFGSGVSLFGNRLAVGAHVFEWSGARTGVGAVFVWSLDSAGTPAFEVGLPRAPTRVLEGIGRNVRGSGTTLVSATDVTMPATVRVYEQRLELGDPCAADADCLSSFCVDGVCCESACGGGALDDCVVCAAALGSSADGACAPVPASEAILCRPAVSACDLPERCDGASVDCPADVMAAAGLPCRMAAGVCDSSEACDGSSPTCPPDGFLGPDTTCRPSVASCDRPETCTGATVECPADDFDGTCPMDAGVRDAGADAGAAAGSRPLDGAVLADADPRDASRDAGGEIVRFGCACRAAHGTQPPPVAALFLLLLFAASFSRTLGRARRAPAARKDRLWR